MRTLAGQSITGLEPVFIMRTQGQSITGLEPVFIMRTLAGTKYYWS